MESNSIIMDIDKGRKIGRQNTQKIGEEGRIEIKTAEKDTLENVNRYDREECSGEQYRKTVSECSSIELLDKRELDRWLMQITEKLSLEEEIEGIVEETERGTDTKIEKGQVREAYKDRCSGTEGEGKERAENSLEENRNRLKGVEREERNKQKGVGKMIDASEMKEKVEETAIDKQEKVEKQGREREVEDNGGKGQSKRVEQVDIEEKEVKVTGERRESEKRIVKSKYWVERPREKEGAQEGDKRGKDIKIRQIASTQEGRNTQRDTVERRGKKKQENIEIRKESNEEERMEREIVGKVIQKTEERGKRKEKKRAVEKESRDNRVGDSRKGTNRDEIEGDKGVDRRRMGKESSSIEKNVEEREQTDRKDTQKEIQVEQKELEGIVKDRLEKSNSCGREQYSRDREVVSECSSIELLDINELDKWLEKETGKLSLSEKTGLEEEEMNRERENKGREEGIIVKENQTDIGKEKVTIEEKLEIQRGWKSLQYGRKVVGRGEFDIQREVDENRGIDRPVRTSREVREGKEEKKRRDRKGRWSQGEREGKVEDNTKEEQEKRLRKAYTQESSKVDIGKGKEPERKLVEKRDQESRDIRKRETEVREEVQRSKIGDEKKERRCRREESRGKEREDSIDSGSIEAQKEKVRETSELGRGREEREEGGENIEQCRKGEKQYGREIVETEAGEASNRIGEREMDNSGSGNWGQEKQSGEYVELLRQERESEGTTSSIAALFWETGLESESKKIGRKKITLRKVWERWRRIVRGEIRKRSKKKKKTERVINREKEDKKLVFDYTSHRLSEEEIQLLERGEAFCVADYKIDEDRNRVDIYNFQRRLRLHELFRDPGDREGGEEESRDTQGERRRNLASRGRRDSVEQTGRRGSRNSVVTTNRGRDIRNRESNRREEVGERRQTPARRRTMIGGRGGRESVLYTGERGNRNSVATVGRRSEIAYRGSESNRTESILRGNGRGSNQGRERNVGEKEINRRLPSIYDPDSKNRNLNRYNACIQEEIMLSMEKKVQFRDNVSKVERKALKLLKSRIEEKEIIITRADKGSGLVAVDYSTYISKGTKYIEEEAGAYEKIQEEEKDILGRLGKERNKIVEQLKEEGVIPIQTATYKKKQLEEKITGIKFYYKIHKDTNIDTMPVRPLQSYIKAPMQHLSIVLTDILQPLLTEKNIPSFIFDSNQLLYRLRNLRSIPDSCTLISSDVSALYPSIPHREGFRAMKIFLQEKTTYSVPQIDTIIKALEIVITDNYMTWNKQIYKQISRVAMGTPVVVAYANIFMDWVDKQVRQKTPYIYEHIRFIDDSLFIIPEDKVEDLIEIANSILPPHIKFTYEKLEQECSRRTGKGLPFLDTQLFISEEKRIESRLYTKKTDRHAYLLPSDPGYHIEEGET